MKTSLEKLPKIKQGELKKILDLIRETEPKIEMIILFGSYARGDFVDKDVYKEKGTIYEYKSDYDILVVVDSEDLALNHGLWREIKDKARKDKTINTPLRIIAEEVQFLNEQLSLGRYFYSDIKKEGIVLFDSKKHKLSEPKKLSKEERKKLATEDYEMWIKKAQEFLEDYEFNLGKDRKNLAAFHLHQATEALYTTVLLVFTGYKPKTHDLYELEDLAINLNKNFSYIFPKENRTDEELFGQLNSAYVDARYKKDYKITQAELKILFRRAKKLFELTETLCRGELGES